MKSAEADREPRGAELAAEIERTRKLIGLHADQRDETAINRPDVADHSFDIDDRITFVEGVDPDVDVEAEHMTPGAFLDQSVNAGEAIGRNGRAPPLDDVAVSIVVRWF